MTYFKKPLWALLTVFVLGYTVPMAAAQTVTAAEARTLTVQYDHGTKPLIFHIAGDGTVTGDGDVLSVRKFKIRDDGRVSAEIRVPVYGNRPLTLDLKADGKGTYWLGGNCGTNCDGNAVGVWSD